mgnify:CR=1 FL=1
MSQDLFYGRSIEKQQNRIQNNVNNVQNQDVSKIFENNKQ